jgi:hypothetical protein
MFEALDLMPTQKQKRQKKKYNTSQANMAYFKNARLV